MASYETALAHIDQPRQKKNAKIELRELKGLGALTLRLDSRDAQLTSACAKAGHPLPERLMTRGAINDTLACWISPDEFLLLFANANRRDSAYSALCKALTGSYFALVDNSGAYVYLLLSGKERLMALRKLCSYNLEGNFPPGKLVATLLAKAPIMLVDLNDSQVLLIARNSFADYIYRALTHAMEEFI